MMNLTSASPPGIEVTNLCFQILFLSHDWIVAVIQRKGGKQRLAVCGMI